MTMRTTRTRQWAGWLVAGALALGAAACDESGGDAAVGADAKADGHSGAPDAGTDGADDPDTAATAMMLLPNTTEGCHEETFLDVDRYPGPGGGHARPSLTVTCADGHMVVATNDIPHYTFVPVTPNALAPQSLTYHVPLAPAVAAEPSAFANTSTVGVSIGGVQLQSPSEAADLMYGDPIWDEALDVCLGHTGFGGAYHMHGADSRCFDPDDDGRRASPILGWMFDGFPIYGPWECVDAACTEVREMKSSYERLNDPTDCVTQSFAYVGDADEDADGDEYLDACNGHFGPDGSYHYHATGTYPYLIGCFKGTPGKSATLYGGPQDVAMEAACEDGVFTGETSGPAACATDADCAGKCLGGTGCVCASGPQGQVCAPSCQTAADCPTDAGGAAMQCLSGTCVPPKK